MPALMLKQTPYEGQFKGGQETPCEGVCLICLALLVRHGEHP